jgi:hypothetical protein
MPSVTLISFYLRDLIRLIRRNEMWHDISLPFHRITFTTKEMNQVLILEYFFLQLYI